MPNAPVGVAVRLPRHTAIRYRGQRFLIHPHPAALRLFCRTEAGYRGCVPDLLWYQVAVRQCGYTPNEITAVLPVARLVSCRAVTVVSHGGKASSYDAVDPPVSHCGATVVSHGGRLAPRMYNWPAGIPPRCDGMITPQPDTGRPDAITRLDAPSRGESR